MTPAQFLARMERRDIAPAYLFLGRRLPARRAREALQNAALGAGANESASREYDLAEISLAEVLDDARALSLFASERLIWLVERGSGAARAGGRRRRRRRRQRQRRSLAAYLKDPTPGVVLVFDAARFDFEGEDKTQAGARAQILRGDSGRGRVPAPTSRQEARAKRAALAKRAGLNMDPAALELLVEALGGGYDAHRGGNRKAGALRRQPRRSTEDDVAPLVPDARATTIFALVAALGRRDRDAGARNSGHAVARGRISAAGAGVSVHAVPQRRWWRGKRACAARSRFRRTSRKMGVPMWGSRAEQVYQTVSKFSKAATGAGDGTDLRGGQRDCAARGRTTGS